MTQRYAQNTEVSSDRSRAEIENTLRHYGADGFAYAAERDQAMIAFRLNGRYIRFRLQMPDPRSETFTRTPTRKWLRSQDEALKVYEQACRQRWRALALVVKAKLEAITAGISTAEEEFLAWTVLPDNKTVGEYALCAIEEGYKTGHMPALLPGMPHQPEALAGSPEELS